MVNIILASKSKVRKKLLEENNINCVVEPSNIDEEQVKEYKKYLNGEIDEPDWVHELDFDLVRDKTGSDDYEIELIDE